MLALKRALKQHQPNIDKYSPRLATLCQKEIFPIVCEYQTLFKSKSISKEKKPQILQYTVEKYLPDIEKAFKLVAEESSGQEVLQYLDNLILRTVESGPENFSFGLENDDSTLVFYILNNKFDYSVYYLDTKLKKLLSDTFDLNVRNAASGLKSKLKEFSKKFSEKIKLVETQVKIKLDIQDFLESTSVKQENKGKAMGLIHEKYLPGILEAYGKIIVNQEGIQVLQQITTIYIKIIDSGKENFSYDLEDNKQTLVFYVLSNKFDYSLYYLDTKLRKLLDDNYGLNVMIGSNDLMGRLEIIKKQFQDITQVQDFQVGIDINAFIGSTDVKQDNKGKVYTLIHEKYFPELITAFKKVKEDTSGEEVLGMLKGLLIRFHDGTTPENFSYTIENDDTLIVLNVLNNKFDYSLYYLDTKLKKLLSDTFDLNVRNAASGLKPKLKEFSKKFSEKIKLVETQVKIKIDIQDFLESTSVKQENKGKAMGLIHEKYLPGILEAYGKIIVNQEGIQVLQQITTIYIKIIDSGKENFSYDLEDNKQTLVFYVLSNKFDYSLYYLDTKLRKLLDDNYGLNVMIGSNDLMGRLEIIKKQFQDITQVQDFQVGIDINAFIGSTDVKQDNKGKVYTLIHEKYFPELITAFKKVKEDTSGEEVLGMLKGLLIRFHDGTTPENFSYTIENDDTLIVLNVLNNKFDYSLYYLDTKLKKLLSDTFDLNVRNAASGLKSKLKEFSKKFSEKIKLVETQVKIKLDIQDFLESTSVKQENKGKAMGLIHEKYLPGILEAYGKIIVDQEGIQVLQQITTIYIKIIDSGKENFSYDLEDNKQTLVFYVLSNKFDYSLYYLDTKLRKLLDDNYGLNVMIGSRICMGKLPNFGREFAKAAGLPNSMMNIIFTMDAFLQSTDVKQDNKGKVFTLMEEKYLPEMVTAFKKIAEHQLGMMALRLFGVLNITFIPDTSKENFSLEYNQSKGELILYVLNNKFDYSMYYMDTKLRKLLDVHFLLQIKIENQLTEPELMKASNLITGFITHPFMIKVDNQQFLQSSDVKIENKSKSIQYIREKYLPALIDKSRGIPHICRDEDGKEAVDMFNSLIIKFIMDTSHNNFSFEVDEDNELIYWYVQHKKFDYSVPSDIANKIESLL
ncbi:selection and upkeep of intraepithelial t-cells protein 2-related [Anaeramoeba flamelloides]|uniref:Selection and upkeep of intraepithelial t-cells protein 2-related n=1 Tax=Anaeramoeba flamelloides TaxID=1746091 RepID=A0AAV7YER0_9EUKA|nr:selection and upkeep of intraepithelial t-cells protein 2-related [Anaeramoeba flamelloides]